MSHASQEHPNGLAGWRLACPATGKYRAVLTVAERCRGIQDVQGGVGQGTLCSRPAVMRAPGTVQNGRLQVEFSPSPANNLHRTWRRSEIVNSNARAARTVHLAQFGHEGTDLLPWQRREVRYLHDLPWWWQ
jgi:hypothetical protein